MADPRFKRGAKKSPRSALLAAMPFRPVMVPPPQFAFVPGKLSVWGNDQYGDCVSAEEAFAKACYSPEIFIDSATVVAWARRHGVLDGATLDEVLKYMQRDGFVLGQQRYNDGAYSGVDYSDEAVLKAALATGPVKIAIDADALPHTAGNQQGWYSLGHGHYQNTDHCVPICGYGPAGWLFQQLGQPLPAGIAANLPGYLVFTWGTIGFVDHPWIMSTCVEAWVRTPTTIGVPPLAPPTPPPQPNPPPPAPPVPPTPPPGEIVTFKITDAAGRVWMLELSPAFALN